MFAFCVHYPEKVGGSDKVSILGQCLLFHRRCINSQAVSGDHVLLISTEPCHVDFNLLAEHGNFIDHTAAAAVLSIALSCSARLVKSIWHSLLIRT